MTKYVNDFKKRLDNQVGREERGGGGEKAGQEGTRQPGGPADEG